MAPPSVKISWHVVSDSGAYTYGFPASEADAALADEPLRRALYTQLQAELQNKHSVLAQLLAMVPNRSQPLRVFLHGSTSKGADLAARYIHEFTPNMWGGLHMYVGRRGEFIPFIAAPRDVIGTFAHELWHAIISRQFPINDMGEFFAHTFNTGIRAWKGDNDQTAFEEAFAESLCHVAMGGKYEFGYNQNFDASMIMYEELIDHETKHAWHIKHGLSSIARQALSCLIPLSATQPEIWRAMIATVLAHGGRLDLSTFVKYFTDDYPEFAHLLPKDCHNTQ